MKKGYYIHFQGRTSIGVSKKIDMQLEEFRKFYEIQELEVNTMERTLLQRVMGLFPTASIARNYEQVLAQISEPDFLYVRRTVADRAYLGFWKEIRRCWPDCKIIIEIFTYPYDKDDFGKWDAWPFYLKELLYRGKLKNYVDRFVTYSDDQEIFGIPTICTTNGVIVEKLCPVKGDYIDGQLRILGVAYMQRQHGYERVIEGMKEYYQGGDHNYQVYLDLVGDGPEKKKYQKLTEKYGLQKYITFYPMTTGETLDELYDRADIAAAVFGMYKVGYQGKVGAIKTRECLAKGVPMISGSPIDVLEEDFPYVKLFGNDSSPVKIAEVTDFFETIKKRDKEKSVVVSKLRECAKQRVSMEVVMKPIVDFIEQS